MKIILTETQLNRITKIIKENQNENNNDINFNNIIKSILSLDDKIVNTTKSIVKSVSDFISPIGNLPVIIKSKFGPRQTNIPGASTNHKGVDIKADSGTEIKSVGDGVVRYAGVVKGYGGFVEIDNGDHITRYGHLQSWNNLKPGMRVKQGSIIGISGGGVNDPNKGVSNGPHLHYEIRDKKTMAAIDPVKLHNNFA